MGSEDVISIIGKDETLKFAGDELTRYLNLLSPKGAEDKGAEFVLALGKEGADDSLPREVKEKAEAVEDDGFLAGLYEGKVYVVGREPRGVLFGIYHLLEREGGIVFAAPGDEYIPSSGSFRVKEPLTLQNPSLLIRGIGLHNDWQDMDWFPVIDWMVKRKFNCLQVSLPSYEERRKKLSAEISKRDILLNVGTHSAFFFMPPERYIKEHPEYYSRAADGTLIGKHLCYTSPEMKKEYIKNILSFLRTHPEIRIVSLWPQDGGGRCECERCRKKGLDRAIPEVVDKAAKAIAVKFPGILVNHLAYSVYTKAPAGMKFCDNTLVNHCDYWDRTLNRPIYDYRQGSPAIHDEEDQAQMKALGKDFRSHRELCEELYEWTQACRITTAFSYYSDLNIKQLLLMDVSRTIQADLNYFRDLGVAGFIDCCCHPQYWEAIASNLFALADFAWDHRSDRAEVLSRFIRGFFPPQAEPEMTDFFRHLDSLLNEPNELGLNTADLLHRSPKEIGYFAGVIEPLIEPARRHYLETIERMRKCLAKARSRSIENGDKLEKIAEYVTDLELQFNIRFNFYLADAYLRRGEAEKAKRFFAAGCRAGKAYPEEFSADEYRRKRVTKFMTAMDDIFEDKI